MTKSDQNLTAFRGPLTWIVAARQAPIYVRGNPTARAWLTFVLERETELAMEQDISPAPSFAIALNLVRGALAKPMAGPPRRPARILVEDRDLVALLSTELGIPVDLSEQPLPEADVFIDMFRRFLAAGGEEEARLLDDPSDEPSYFDEGLPRPLVHELIKAGAALAKVRPWDTFPNQTLIRLDIPELGVREACICILGSMGESRSIVVFRSREDYLVSMGRGDRLASRSEFSVEPLDPGVPLLALDFENAADVPARMRDEAAAMGLKPGRKTLYPHILCVEADGVRRPASEHDLRLIVALATALEQTFRRYGRRIGDPDAWPLCEETQVGESLVARLTVPFEAGVLFGINEPPPIEAGTTGLGEPEGSDAGVQGVRRAEVVVEGMSLLLALAAVKFPGAAREMDRAEEKDDGDSLTVPWALFHRSPKKSEFTVVETLLANNLASPEAVAWLEAQRQSWISAWHIALGSNDQFSCRDLITGEIRVFVHADPRTRGRLAPGDVFLGRIVDFEHWAEIFGAGPHTLPLNIAGEVAESVRRALRTTQVTPAMLRSHRGGSVARREWNAALNAWRAR